MRRAIAPYAPQPATCTPRSVFCEHLHQLAVHGQQLVDSARRAARGRDLLRVRVRVRLRLEQRTGIRAGGRLRLRLRLELRARTSARVRDVRGILGLGLGICAALLTGAAVPLESEAVGRRRADTHC